MKLHQEESLDPACGNVCCAVDQPRNTRHDHINAHDHVDRIAEIERLAALDPVDYEVTRGEAAKRLNLRVSLLDREVEKTRRALGLDADKEDNGKGRVVKIVDPLPWHEPVGGDMIGSALAAGIKHYAVLSDEAAATIALWILHTWTVDHFTISHGLPLPARPKVAARQPSCACLIG